jgi:Na+/H+ antiporter NhaD/arsenite permease-like protein
MFNVQCPTLVESETRMTPRYFGSLSRLRAAQISADIQVGFWDYARFGIPITILTTAAGVVVLLVLR